MATLNLVPNPEVLVVQAGVFLANLVVVRNLFVEPYLKVRDKRESLTFGSKDDASRILKDCEALAKNMEASLDRAADEAKAARLKLREQALTTRTQVLGEAALASKKIIEGVEKQIGADIEAERVKVPQIVAALTEEVYKLALQ